MTPSLSRRAHLCAFNNFAAGLFKIYRLAWRKLSVQIPSVNPSPAPLLRPSHASANAGDQHANHAPLLRREDAALLRGQGQFGQDIALPDLLHIAFVRSPQAHATLTGIDTAQALQCPGVIQVLTAQDLGHAVMPDINPLLALEEDTHFPLLAGNQVQFVGQPVAVVVARDRHTARHAAALVTLSLDTLASQNDFNPDAAITTRTQHHAGEVPDKPALEVSSHISNPRVTAFAMEPRACTAQWLHADQQLRVWLGTQTPTRAQADMAKLLGLAPHKVHLVSPDVGGAFGARASVGLEDLLVAWVAHHLQAAVQWVATRSEDMLSGMQGRGSQLQASLRFNADGQLLSLEAKLHFTLGAWLPFSAVVPLRNAARILPGPYQLPHLNINGVATRANAAPVNIYRGAGRPEAALLMETLIEHAARQCQIDPVVFRQRNLISPEAMPYHTATGECLDSGHYALALERACERFQYAQQRQAQQARRARGECVGIGLAMYIEPCGQGWESARITWHNAQHVSVASGSPAQGQGHATTFAQLVADTLHVSVDQVDVQMGDTRTCPAGTGALASRSIAIGGSAIVQACEKALALQRQGAPFPIVVEHTFTAKEAWSYGCVVVRMQIDVETGQPTLEHMVWVDDAGHVLQPALVHGQLIGGAAQGIGQALMERMVYDDQGQLITGSLMDYALPRADNMPPIVMVSLHTPSPHNVLGAKGVGEAGCIGVPAAIMNAARDALSPIGEPTLHFPLTSEQLWRALHSH